MKHSPHVTGEKAEAISVKAAQTVRGQRRTFNPSLSDCEARALLILASKEPSGSFRLLKT